MYLKRREKNGLGNLRDSKGFIKYSNDIQDVYKNIEDFNLSRKCNALIVFDEMIANIISNKKLSPIVTKLFTR